MRGGRLLQPLMVTHRIKELLLWMTLRTNEYEYIYKNRHRLPSHCRLGVTVTLAGHGWWEREPLPLEMEDVAGIRQTATQTHTQVNAPAWSYLKRLQHLRKTRLSFHCYFTIVFTHWMQTNPCIKHLSTSLLYHWNYNYHSIHHSLCLHLCTMSLHKRSVNIMCEILSSWEAWKRISFTFENPQVLHC